MNEAQVVAYQWLDTAHYRKKLPFEAVSQLWRPLVLASDYDKLRKQLDEARDWLVMVSDTDGFLEPHQIGCIDAWLEANK